jgi:hypothetical protein
MITTIYGLDGDKPHFKRGGVGIACHDTNPFSPAVPLKMGFLRL